MGFGRRNSGVPVSDPDSVSPEQLAPLQTYDVTYRGGLRELPKAKVGKIVMEIHPDRFSFLPGNASKKFWSTLEIPFSTISGFEIVERTLSTFEGLAGGVNSRQLNQKNNIHITYSGVEGQALLRLEMLSGVTVMGQAKKCNELEDRLRTFRVREQFVVSPTSGGGDSLSDELNKIASLKAFGVLTDEEFAAAKARVLGS